MNYERDKVVSRKLRITIQNHDEHTVHFPTPGGPITLKVVSISEIIKSIEILTELRCQ